MRHNNHSLSLFRLRRWLLFTILACLCLIGGNSGRTTSAQQPANNSAEQKGRTKRLTPLRTSDTSDGSRVTITSDGELNDYSAYRSGDRFIVVVPQAEGAGGGGVRGRGFEGAQVERRGKDLVYTFKLQPGATARVNQRFNRLDVQFSAPKEAAQTANAPTKTPTPAPTPKTTPTPQIATNKSAANANAQPTPEAQRTPEATANNSAAANISPFATPSPNVGTLAPAATPLNAAASPTATLTPTATPPGAEQLAQAQATPAAPVSITTTSAPSTSSTSFGAVVLRNWPWLIAALLAVGIGLLFVSRVSGRDKTAATTPPRATPATPPATLKATKTSELKPAVASSNPAATVAPVAATSAATLATSGRQSKKQKKRAEKAKKLADSSAPKTGAHAQTDPKNSATSDTAKDALIVATGAASIGAASATSSGTAKVEESNKEETKVGAAKGTQTKAVEPIIAFAPESIDAAIKKLLAGESYDEKIINTADAGTRQLVSSELMSAIAGRNLARREHARAAFLKYGYFDAATRDLQSAEAPAERASAARTLGLIADRSATPHLVAALEDPAADVRRTAVEALAELSDPSAIGALEALRWRETSRQVPRALIQRAIEASQPIEEETATTAIDIDDDTPTLVTPTVAVTSAQPEIQRSDATGTETQQSEVAGAISPMPEESLIAAPELMTAETTAPVLPVNNEAAAIDETEVTLETKALEVADVAAPLTEPILPGDKIETTETDADTESISGEMGTVSGETDLASTLAAKESSLIRARAREQEMPSTDAMTENAAEVITASPAIDAAASTVESISVSPESDAPAEIMPELTAEPRASETGWSLNDLTSSDPVEGRTGSETNAATVEAQSQPTYYSDFAVNSGGQPAASEDDWIDLDADERALPIQAIESETSRPPSQAEAPGPFFADDAVLRWSPTQATETTVPPAAETSQPETAALFESLEVETFEDAAPPVPVEATPIEASELVDAPTQPLSAPDWASTTGELRGTEVVKAEKGLSVTDGSDEDDYSIIPKGIQSRLGSEEPSERAASVLALSRLDTDEAFGEICAAFDDPAVEVRTAAARALYDLAEDRADSFTRALREAAPERRRQIGAALATSGLADEAIGNLTGESRDRTYDAFSLLFLMAKAGEVAPLIHAIESHPDSEVRLAVVKLLALSGQHDILPSFRRLAVRGSLPTEVRSAVMEAIYQISSTPSPNPTHTT